MRKGMRNRITAIVTLIVALLSCLAINFVGAKYYSEINEGALVPTADFVVNIKTDEGQNNLTLTPSPNGSFVAVEFTISNANENSISGVDQDFAIGLIIDTETVVRFSQMSNTEISLQPMLVCTNDLTSSINDVYGYMMSGSFPPGFQFARFENFNIIGDYSQENILDYEYIPFTWTYGNNDDVLGDLDGVLKSPEYDEIVYFNFNKTNAQETRFFLVFFVVGSLPVGISYDFRNLQLAVYSQQAIGEYAS